MTTIWAPLLLIGCFWERQEREWQERLFQMEDHAADGREAFVALASGDLDEAREAARRLAAPDEVPGISEAGEQHLAAVRAEAKRAAKAREPHEVAQALVAMTAHCSACHASYDLGPSVLMDTDDPMARVFGALAFESEADWDEAAAELDLQGDDWARRRAAVVEHLGAR